MANQNFTTYTEVDPSSHITVTSAKVSWTDLSRNETAYVYKDFGTDKITSITNLVELKITSIDNGNYTAVWGLANSVDSFQNIANKIYLLVVNNGGTYSLKTNDDTSEDAYTISLDTVYYLKIVRDTTVGTYGTLYCYIYSDSGRTTLLDTLSIALSSTAGISYRYLYTVNTFYRGFTDKQSGYVENLNFFYEDFTSYTEQDADAKLAETITRVTLSTGASHDTYLYKDFGAGYFNTSFRHNFNFKVTDISAGNATIVWGMGNDLGDANDLRLGNKHLLNIDYYKSGANAVLESVEYYSGSSYANGSYTLTVNTLYYAQTYFNPSVGTYGTLYFYLYTSDSDRTAGTNAVASFSLAIHAALSFRYLYAIQSYAQSPAGACYEEYLNLSASAPLAGPANVKSWNGLAIASVKKINGLAIASVKKINGLA